MKNRKKPPYDMVAKVSKKVTKRPLYIVGIDEAGRGPLAGPVAVGVFIVERKKAKNVLKKANDSKKISEIKREVIFEEAKGMSFRGMCYWDVSLIRADIIDKKGISFAIRTGLSKSLSKVIKHFKLRPAEVEVLLDGSLYAPKEYVHQETIIKGDSLVPVIGMASIMAKVTRDRYMIRLAKKYPEYGFDIHKGYGTKKHYFAIKRAGISPEHRKTWIKSSID